MKLVKHNTTDFGSVDLYGNIARSSHWGQKHYFLIENATAEELEAIEDMLEAKGWDTDGCPCYEDGFGAGFHIDIEEVDAFKADYKAAKKGLKAFMAARAEEAEVVVAADVAEEAAHVEAVLTEEAEVEAVSNYDLQIPACSADVAAAVAAQRIVPDCIKLPCPTLAEPKTIKRTYTKRRTVVEIAGTANGINTFRIRLDNGRIYLFTEGEKYAQIKMPGGKFAETTSQYTIGRLCVAISEWRAGYPDEKKPRSKAGAGSLINHNKKVKSWVEQ